MKQVLYITNGEAPYRSIFFDKLSEKVDLTVGCEYAQSSNREKDWYNGQNTKHKTIYFGVHENSQRIKTTLKLVAYVLKTYKQYDEIIFGCVNSRAEMIAYSIMRLLGKKYSLNLDGETFFSDRGFKKTLKKFFLKKASKYYIAGEKALETSCQAIGFPKNTAYKYNFSSLSKEELISNAAESKSTQRMDYILAIGRYFEYKGLDIVLQVAKKHPETEFRLIGMGNQTDELQKLVHQMHLNNITLIPFLESKALGEEYLRCKAFVLPSRRECWGLVINEAASYGTPIVSTYGSGAAVEFLKDDYSEFLAKPNDAESLEQALTGLIKKDSQFLKQYSEYLINKSFEYSIEKSVDDYLAGIESGR